MNFKVMKGCVISGQPYSSGDVVNIEDERLISSLIGIGRISLHTEAEIVIEDIVEEHIELENRSVALKQSTKKVNRRAKN